MTAVDLICCPYDSGRRDWRCGLGPRRILQQDAVARIQSGGTDVRLVEIETWVSYEAEASLVFEAQRQIARSVAKARDSGRLPLVLGRQLQCRGGRRQRYWRVKARRHLV